MEKPACDICLGELNVPVCTPCGHLHCETCLHIHIETEMTRNMPEDFDEIPRFPPERVRSTCPTCRFEFLNVPVDALPIPRDCREYIQPAIRRVYVDWTFGSANVRAHVAALEDSLWLARHGHETEKRSAEVYAAQASSWESKFKEQAKRLNAAEETVTLWKNICQDLYPGAKVRRDDNITSRAPTRKERYRVGKNKPRVKIQLTHKRAASTTSQTLVPTRTRSGRVPRAAVRLDPDDPSTYVSKNL